MKEVLGLPCFRGGLIGLGSQPADMSRLPCHRHDWRPARTWFTYWGPCAQVAVVGTAHVRGILREWEAAGADWRERLDGLLADEVKAA